MKLRKMKVGEGWETHLCDEHNYPVCGLGIRALRLSGKPTERPVSCEKCVKFLKAHPDMVIVD